MNFLTNLLTSPAAMLLDYYAEPSDEAILGASMAVMAVYYLIVGIVSLLTIIGNWVLFNKARKPGWYSIIPILNTYTLFDIVYGAGWKFLLMLVPGLNIVVAIMVYVRLAQVFGKGAGYIILMLFFTPIAMLMLAFGNARYKGPCRSFL